MVLSLPLKFARAQVLGPAVMQAEKKASRVFSVSRKAGSQLCAF